MIHFISCSSVRSTKEHHSQNYHPTILSKKRKSDNTEAEDEDNKDCMKPTAQTDTIRSKRLRSDNEFISDPSEGLICRQGRLTYLTPPNCPWTRPDATPVDNLQTPECLRPCHSCINLNQIQSPSRTFALPTLNWADSKEVWKIMLSKQHRYRREKEMLKKHPAIQARMRAILLDWLTEVCEVYHLHRETYYLTMDFIDRYLACNSNIPKQQLQLIGITSLFMAAKLEEIYPPKVTDFAYVTDGACTYEDILQQEMIILKALEWELTPMTPNSWLNIYMQLSSLHSQHYAGEDFIVPKYSGSEFVKVAQLIDLCTLDIDCLQFSYHIIAASALYHMTSPEVFHLVTDVHMKDAYACVSWLTPFALTIKELHGTDSKFVHSSLSNTPYNIQTHSVNMELLEKAQQRQMQISLSPGSPVPFSGILTPPQSKEKNFVSEC